MGEYVQELSDVRANILIEKSKIKCLEQKLNKQILLKRLEEIQAEISQCVIRLIGLEKREEELTQILETA
mgnify:CR=1 FL=1